MSIRDVDSTIMSSKTNILYLIFPRYNEKIWLDFWNHPRIVEHFIKPNKPHLVDDYAEASDPNKFKEVYKYYKDTSKHIVINYVNNDSRLPVTQSTLRTEDVHESLVRYIGFGKNKTEIIRMTDEPEGPDLEALLFGENYGN